jgi:pimeloyl-ACP methyl ester carboxylesterase
VTRSVKRALWALILLLAGGAAAFGVFFYLHPLDVLVGYQRWSLTRAGLKKEWIRAPGGRLAVWTGGQGKTLVLVHTLSDNAGTWHAVVPDLLRHYRVVILDLPGHRDSEPRQGELTLRGELDGVVAVIQQRGGRDPVTLIGNGVGGWMAISYAREHPERVERLVVISGVGLTFDVGDIALVPKTREEARRFVDALYGPDTPPTPDFILDDVIRRSRRNPFTRLMGNLRSSDQLGDRLTEVRVPADLIWGEADGIVTREVTLRMLEGLPGARLHTLPRCGHLPQQECPELLVKALLDILSSPPPPVPAPFSSLP